MKILLHSSKTMKPESTTIHELTTPQFINEAVYINQTLRSLDESQLASLMSITTTLAGKVKERIGLWDSEPKGSAAALTFRGDIYSGLSAGQWDRDDAAFAQDNLLIMSGLYGLLKPFDGIKPYRLEMGYKLQLPGDLRLDRFWEKQLARKLDIDDTYINLTAKEYFMVVESQLKESCVISPKFLTVNNKTGAPTFVTVHAKIARGSFANWLIKNKVNDPKNITDFNYLNYAYDQSLSMSTEPVFVCREFGGLGLSIRLK